MPVWRLLRESAAATSHKARKRSAARAPSARHSYSALGKKSNQEECAQLFQVHQVERVLKQLCREGFHREWWLGGQHKRQRSCGRRWEGRGTGGVGVKYIFANDCLNHD